MVPAQGNRANQPSDLPRQTSRATFGTYSNKSVCHPVSSLEGTVQHAWELSSKNHPDGGADSHWGRLVTNNRNGKGGRLFSRHRRQDLATVQSLKISIKGQQHLGLHPGYRHKSQETAALEVVSASDIFTRASYFHVQNGKASRSLYPWLSWRIRPAT
jgi:hypothetical protein